MSVQVEMRTAAPERSSSDMSPIAVALLVGAIAVALLLSISTGLTAEPQMAGYLDSIAFP